MVRLVLAISALMIVAGCTAHSVSRTMPATADISAHSPAEKLCTDMFAGRSVLGWTSTDVAGLRAYQFGGPIPHVPLRSAFPGIPATQVGAWCVVREGPQSNSLWGAVAGARPVRAITVTGPGEGTFRGEMLRPPQPP